MFSNLEELNDSLKLVILHKNDVNSDKILVLPFKFMLYYDIALL